MDEPSENIGPVLINDLDQAARDLLTCPTCLSEMLTKRPVVIGRCGHTICDVCIEKITAQAISQGDGHSRCPICREAFNTYHLKTNFNVRSFAEQLPCQCPEAPNGCEWTGTVGAFQEHIKSECQHAHVPCAYRRIGCRELVSRKDLAEHERLCSYGPWQCGHCSAVGMTTAYANWHLVNECPAYPQHRCVAGCSFAGTREQLSAHKRNECQVISYCCPMNNCHFKAPRAKMSSHLVKCHTFGRVNQKHDNLRKRRRVLLDEISRMDTEISIMAPSALPDSTTTHTFPCLPWIKAFLADNQVLDGGTFPSVTEVVEPSPPPPPPT